MYGSSMACPGTILLSLTPAPLPSSTCRAKAAGVGGDCDEGAWLAIAINACNRSPPAAATAAGVRPAASASHTDCWHCLNTEPPQQALMARYAVVGIFMQDAVN